MTNSINNTCNKQYAAEIDLSDFNRSYIVGNALDASHLLVLDVRTTLNDNGDSLLVHSEYVLLDTVPVEGLSGYVDLNDVYTPIGSSQMLSGKSSANEKYVFLRNHTIEVVPDIVINSVSYAREDTFGKDTARFYADKATGFSTEGGAEFTWVFNSSSGLGSLQSVLKWLRPKKQWLDVGFIPLSGGHLSKSDVNLSERTLTKTIDSRKHLLNWLLEIEKEHSACAEH